MKSKAGNHALLLAGVQTGAMPKIELCGNRANRPRLFQRKIPVRQRFLLGARYYAGLQKYKMASFHLHQAAENYLRTIPLVYILYGYKDHALEILMDRCKTHTLQLVSVFPRNTEEERRLFNLLQDAYVQARYNKDFVVTKTDIDALIPRLELMRDITEKVCCDRIAYYERQS